MFTTWSYYERNPVILIEIMIAVPVLVVVSVVSYAVVATCVLPERNQRKAISPPKNPRVHQLRRALFVLQACNMLDDTVTILEPRLKIRGTRLLKRRDGPNSPTYEEAMNLLQDIQGYSEQIPLGLPEAQRHQMLALTTSYTQQESP